MMYFNQLLVSWLDTKFDTRTKNLENGGSISVSGNRDKAKSYGSDKQLIVVLPAEAVMVICCRAGGLVKVFQHGCLNNHTLKL